MTEKINPAVVQMIQPIMQRMTAIHLAERNMPVIGASHNDPYKDDKQQCVHFIYNGNQPECMLEKTADGKLKCKACGREIGTKFDKSAVETLIEARKVIEQIMFFGMINNMTADLISGCIQIKSSIPALALLIAQLSDFVKREESNMDTVSNIGDEYRFKGITGAF